MRLKPHWSLCRATLAPLFNTPLYCALTDRMVIVPGFQFLQVCLLRCGTTFFKKLWHIFEALHPLFLECQPFPHHGVAIDVDVLLLLANAWCVALWLAAASKEEDFMSIPNALIIIACMSEIAHADFAKLDPPRRAQAVAVR